MGQNGSENVGDHKLASDLGKNRSENSPTRLKTGRRFSVSDLSPTVNAQPAIHALSSQPEPVQQNKALLCTCT